MIWAGEELLLGGMGNSLVTELQEHPEIAFGAAGASNLRVKSAALIIVQSKRPQSLLTDCSKHCLQLSDTSSHPPKLSCQPAA